jgi:hypothetical protein
MGVCASPNRPLRCAFPLFSLPTFDTPPFRLLPAAYRFLLSLAPRSHVSVPDCPIAESPNRLLAVPLPASCQLSLGLLPPAPLAFSPLQPRSLPAASCPLPAVLACPLPESLGALRMALSGLRSPPAVSWRLPRRVASAPLRLCASSVAYGQKRDRSKESWRWCLMAKKITWVSLGR